MKLKMEFRTMDVDVLLQAQAKYNPRKNLKPGDEEYEQIKRSIQGFGFVQPPVFNIRTQTLVGGHQRLKCLKDLGGQNVEVVIVDLPVEQEKLLNIALNKVQGAWDFEKLAELLDELSKMPELDETLTGFTDKEIGQVFDRYLDVGGDDDFDADTQAAVIEQPITQPGDIIELGQHRIMCADAAEPDNLGRLFQGECADLYWSDWPYRVSYDSTRRPGSSGKKLWEKITGDDFSEEEYDAWMQKVIEATKPHLKDGASLYVWTGHKEFWTMQYLLKQAGFKPSCVITWAKPSISPSYASYQWQTEFCLFGWKLGAAHAWYGKAESSLWEVNRDPVSQLKHATQKPLELVHRALKNSSQRGDLVLDSCLGSGSCLIAADNLGRRCFGFEIDVRYCDVIVRRYMAHVGPNNVAPELKARYFSGGEHGRA